MSQYAPYHASIISPQNRIQNHVLRCPYSKCTARIIKPSSAHQIVELKDIGIQFIRPSSALKAEETIEGSEDVVEEDGKFLEIKDVWDFDNIGVSKDFDNSRNIERLIICSDCDRGPLGFARFDHDNEERNVKDLRYFLNLGSCLYQEE